jgi:hypothetical protein
VGTNPLHSLVPQRRNRYRRSVLERTRRANSYPAILSGSISDSLIEMERVRVVLFDMNKRWTIIRRLCLQQMYSPLDDLPGQKLAV